jgi:hypothetical protein
MKSDLLQVTVLNGVRDGLFTHYSPPHHYIYANVGHLPYFQWRLRSRDTTSNQGYALIQERYRAEGMKQKPWEIPETNQLTQSGWCPVAEGQGK